MAEPVIEVTRDGRSDLDVERAVANQLRHWLAGHARRAGRFNELEIALAVQLLAADHISPQGSGDVRLSRDVVLTYLTEAAKKIQEM